QFPPFAGFEVDLLPGLALEQEVAPPRRERVGPGLDCVGVATGLLRHKSAGPTVIVVMPHRLAVPGRLIVATPQQRCRDDIMAIANYVGPDLDRLAGDPFDGKA